MKSMAIMFLAVCICLIPVYGSFAAEQQKDKVAYPEGYRMWTHLKSMIIESGHKAYDLFGGIHHLYANKKALEAMTKGKPYPDGSVFVFDLLDVQSKDNTITEGPRKLVGVMEKNAKKYAATGGWGFEAFKGDTKDRTVTDPAKCFACHEKKKDSGYVMSQFRK